VLFPHRFIPLDGRRTERSWPIPSCDYASVMAVKWASPNFLMEISDSPQSPFPNMIISIPLCPRFPPAFFNPSSPQDRLHTIHRLSILNAGFLAASTLCTRSICCQRHFLIASRVFLRRSRTVLSSIPVSLQPQESRMSFNLKISKILIKRTDFELDR
jgi:hypothetical protein